MYNVQLKVWLFVCGLMAISSCSTLEDVRGFESKYSSFNLPVVCEEPVTQMAGLMNSTLCDAEIKKAINGVVGVVPTFSGRSGPHLAIRVETFIRDKGAGFSVLSGLSLFTFNLLGMPIGVLSLIHI